MSEPALPGPLDALASWAAEQPDDLALVAADVTWTAAELWDAVLRVARGLRQHDVAPRELVAIAGPAPLRPVLTLGALAAGVVPITRAPGLPDLLVVALEPVPDVPGDRLLVLSPESLAAPLDADPASLVFSPAPHDPALAVGSSGTTGTPKVVVFTHGQVRRRMADAQRTWMPPEPVAILLGTGSISGQIGFLANLDRRTAHVVPDDAATNVRVLRENRIAFATGSPPQLAELLRAARAADERLPDLTALQSVGSPITPGLAAELRAWFGVPVSSMYGSTETGAVAVVEDATVPDAPARPYAAASLRVVGDDGAPLPPGTPGAVQLRTAGMATGYLDAPELFRDGWFAPGDLGSLDADGLRLYGRVDDLINASGIKVMPERIEQAALRLPGILDAAAAGVDDRHGVRRIALAIVCADPVDPAAIVAALRPALGDATPKIVMRVPQLPRTETGKLKRTEIVELMRARLGPLIDL